MSSVQHVDDGVSVVGCCWVMVRVCVWLCVYCCVCGRGACCEEVVVVVGVPVLRLLWLLVSCCVHH